MNALCAAIVGMLGLPVSLEHKKCIRPNRRCMAKKSKKSAILILVLIYSNQVLVYGAGRELELTWNELAPLISGRNIELVAPKGAFIKGEVIAVREDALVMDVTKTSDSIAYPKGNIVFPRASVTVLNLQRARGAWGRSIGTVIGVLCGITVGGYVAITKTNSASAGIPTFLGISSGTTLAGYYLGKNLDKRTTQIRVIS
jgi:hypothetical protein